jgi:predicted DNA-binding protein (MmcQ/YjbR family)
MDYAALEAYCLSLPGAVREFPFGPDAAVYKVMNKMFALMPVGGELSISLKCDPLRAVMLRDTYPAITGAYHMNKTHWNQVRPDGSIPDDEVLELIDHSYDLVVQGLPKADRDRLAKWTSQADTTLDRS